MKSVCVSLTLAECLQHAVTLSRRTARAHQAASVCVSDVVPPIGTMQTGKGGAGQCLDCRKKESLGWTEPLGIRLVSQVHVNKKKKTTHTYIKM